MVWAENKIGVSSKLAIAVGGDTPKALLSLAIYQKVGDGATFSRGFYHSPLIPLSAEGWTHNQAHCSRMLYLWTTVTVMSLRLYTFQTLSDSEIIVHKLNVFFFEDKNENCLLE